MEACGLTESFGLMETCSLTEPFGLIETASDGGLQPDAGLSDLRKVHPSIVKYAER